MAVPGDQEIRVSRRRPRDRKQHILAAAEQQFWHFGYDQVSMADVAEAVGIGASALYRHFRGKRDLLAAVLDRALSEVEELLAGVPDLSGLLDEMARGAAVRREFAVLWDRDRGHVDDATRDGLEERMREVVGTVARIVTPASAAGAGDTVPDEDVARLRAHAVLAVFGSPSRHRLDLDVLSGLLAGAAAAVVAAPLPTGSAEPVHPPSVPLLPATRREAILAAATRLFHLHGYPAVGLTDIGAATGISGPSIYNHFESKTAILIAALTRGNEALWLALHRALSTVDTPADGLRQVVASYVDIAVSHPATTSVLLFETINLPDELRREYRQAQQNYVQEWVALLTGARPDLAPLHARALVHCALSVVNQLVQSRRLLARPALRQEAAQLAAAVLATPGG